MLERASREVQRDAGDPGVLVRGAISDVRHLVCDIDGTLSDRAGSDVDQVRLLLDRLAHAGISVTLITGRPPRLARAFARSASHHGYTVSAHGAALLHGPDQRPVQVFEPLTLVDLLSARHALAQIGTPRWAIETDSECIVDALWEPASRGWWECSEVPDCLRSDPFPVVLKSLVHLSPSASPQEVQFLLSPLGLISDEMSRDGTVYGIRRRSHSKGQAMRRWGPIMNITAASNTLVAVDSLADQDLWEWAGVAVLVRPEDPNRSAMGSTMGRAALRRLLFRIAESGT